MQATDIVRLDANAIPLSSRCSPCVVLETGPLEPGDVGIIASEHDLKARRGSTVAKTYLASTEVVAASSMTGQISGPG